MAPTWSIMFWRALTISLISSMILAQMIDPATLTASIRREKAYSLLPPCINQCLSDIGNNDARTLGGDLGLQLSCSAPSVNGCFCRPASASFAQGFIASCATRLCTAEPGGNLPKSEDVASGQSIYASYCSNALGAQYNPEAVQQAPAPTPPSVPEGLGGASRSGAASTRATTTLPKQTGQASPSATDSSSAGSGSSPGSSTTQKDERIMGLSKGAFIGVVVSASCSILGLIFGIAFKVYRHKKQQRKNVAEMHEGATGVYYTTKR